MAFDACLCLNLGAAVEIVCIVSSSSRLWYSANVQSGTHAPASPKLGARYSYF